ncbi:MAG TPA: ferredoxin family protein [Phycisphaerales bacterium]|nr:ferredoxin family protein [Phycisphaerales bacterium]
MRLWDASFPEPSVADIHLNLERCKGCGLCIGACPIDNVRMTENLNSKGYCYAEIIDKDKCTGCALCARMCPEVAIRIDG